MTGDVRSFTTSDGVRLAYGVAGEGVAGEGAPELVFLHGWCCNRSAFAPQAAFFSRRHRTLSLDLRGHGESAKPTAGPGVYSVDTLADDAIAVVRDAAFARPIVVGHSLGGLVALACAARDGARAAVLINPPLLFDPAVRAWARRSVAAIEQDDSGAWRKAFAERLLLPTDRAYRSELDATIATTPAPIAAAAWEAIAGYDPEGSLARARVPLLVLHSGGEDLRHFTALTAGAGLALGVTVGAGHFNQLEVPDQVNAMIDRFVRML
jgi:pimeloyl-ACP methyl ester carboxylesterase